MLLTLYFDYVDNMLNIIDDIFRIATNIWYSQCGDA